MPLFKKKPKAENLEELRDITDDVIEADFVPFACHWNPHTIVTKNGEIFQTIKITGFAQDKAAQDDADDADVRSKIRQAILSSVNSVEYGLWIHTVRRHKSLQTGGEFKRDFSGYLNRFWNDRNDWQHQFANEIFITVVREGQAASLADMGGFWRGIFPPVDIRYREKYLDEGCDKLTEITDKMLAVLEPFGARRLTVVQRGDTYYSEPCEFLGKIITMQDIAYPVSDMDMSHYLTDYDVTFGFNAMEVRMRANGQRRFGSILTLKEYRELPVEALDKFLHVPTEFIISQYFDFIQAKRALKTYERQKELFDISKAGTLAEKTGLQDILASHQGRPIDFGLSQITIFMLADSIRNLENGVLKAATGLTSLGMLPMREDIKFEECYWAQLPANFEFIKRLRPINSVRIAGFANLTNQSAGNKNDNHWGPAVTTLYTAGHTPYFFNFHVGDNGHTTIIGPEGAGKTVILNFLLSEACKFDSRLFYFDKDRRAEIFLRSLGGTYCNPYPQADPRPYAQITLNPFQLEDSPANREFLKNWLAALSGKAEEDGVKAACEKAVDAVMLRLKPERRLAVGIDAIREGNPELAAAYSPWVDQGEYAALFHQAEETFSFESRIQGFEMGGILANSPTIVPVLSYLLHRIMLTLDGKPTVIVLNEAWALLENPLFATRLKKWLEMLRANNAIMIFATENLEEAVTGSITPILMDNAVATQIFLPDEMADEAYNAAFGLSEKEISYLTVMNTEDHHFLIRQGANPIVAEMNLSGMADIVAVLAATDAHLLAMEQSIAAQGMQQAQWMPKFLEQI